MRWIDRLGSLLAAMFLARPSLELANRTGLPSRVTRRAERTRAERMGSFGDRRLRRVVRQGRRAAAERAEATRLRSLGWTFHPRTGMAL